MITRWQHCLNAAMITRWHYYIDAAMITRWWYCLNAAMISRWQHCLSAAMITRWNYCISVEMVTGWVHWIGNVSKVLQRTMDCKKKTSTSPNLRVRPLIRKTGWGTGHRRKERDIWMERERNREGGCSPS